MKNLWLFMAIFLSFSATASEDIVGECRFLFKDKCDGKDLVSCMKSNMGNAELETCTGILLSYGDAPKAVQGLQTSQLFDSSKAGCFDVIAKNCGEMEVSECVAKKGNLFPQNCRDLYFEINEQQSRLDSIGSSCFKKNLDFCNQKHDVPLTSFSAFTSSMKNVEGCISNKILASSECTKKLEEKAKVRREEAEAQAAAEAEKSEEEDS